MSTETSQISYRARATFGNACEGGHWGHGLIAMAGFMKHHRISAEDARSDNTLGQPYTDTRVAVLTCLDQG